MAGNITEFENEIKNLPDQKLIERWARISESAQNYDGARGNDDYKKQVSIIDKVLKERGLSAAQYAKISDIVKAINNNEIDYSTIQKFKDEQLEPLKERVAQLEVHLDNLNKEPKPSAGKKDDLKSFSESFNKKIDSLKEEIKKIKEQIDFVKTDGANDDHTTIEGFNKIKSLNIDDKKFNEQVDYLNDLALEYNKAKDEYNDKKNTYTEEQSNEKKQSIKEKKAAVDNFAKQITNLLDEKNNALEKIKIRPQIFDEDIPEGEQKIPPEEKLEEIDKCKKNVKKIMSEDAASRYLNELTFLEKKIREFADTDKQSAVLQSSISKTEASIKANKEKIEKTERILESVDKWNGVLKSSEKTKALTNIYNNKNDKTKELNPEEAQKKLQSLLGWEPIETQNLLDSERIKTQNNIVRSTKRKKGAKDDEFRTYKVGDWIFEYSGNVETNGNEIIISDNGKPFLTIKKNDGKVEKMEVHQDACLMVEGKPFYIPKDSTVNVRHTKNGVVISVINGRQEATITVENGSITTSGDSFINWENRPKKEERAEETAQETKIEADTIEETPQAEDVIEDREREPEPKRPQEEYIEPETPQAPQAEGVIEDTERATQNKGEMNHVDDENVDHQNTTTEKEEVKEETNTNNVAAGNVDPQNTTHVNSDVKEESKENNFLANVVGVFKNIFSWMGNNNEQTSESSNIQDNKNSKTENNEERSILNPPSENNIDNQQNDINTELKKLNGKNAPKSENEKTKLTELKTVNKINNNSSENGTYEEYVLNGDNFNEYDDYFANIANQAKKIKVNKICENNGEVKTQSM